MEIFRGRIGALAPRLSTGYCLYEQTAGGHPGARISAETGEPMNCKEESFEFPPNCKPGVYYVQFYALRKPLPTPLRLVTWVGSGGGASPKPDVREAAQQQPRMAKQFAAGHDHVHPSIAEHPDYLSAQLDHSVSSLAYSERALLATDTRQAINAPMSEHDAKPVLIWQNILSEVDGNPQRFTYRSKIPGGWFVRIDYDLAIYGANDGTGTSITFVPDPEHKWDGGSVE